MLPEDKVSLEGGIQASVFVIESGSEKLLMKKHKMSSVFIRELNVLSGLDHPNIVKIKCKIEDRKSLVFPYYPMGDLWNVDESFTLNNLKDFLRQLLDAILYLRKKGLVHADIKPQNIVRDGDGFLLIDFGLATPIKIFYLDSLHTKTDFFSLGVTVWTLRVKMQGRIQDIIQEVAPVGGTILPSFQIFHLFQLSVFSKALLGVEKLNFPEYFEDDLGDFLRKLLSFNPQARNIENDQEFKLLMEHEFLRDEQSPADF